MNRKTKNFVGAFTITLILLLATAGFIAVDLSTDRYMPNQFGPFFEIKSINASGMVFSFLAGDYFLDASYLTGLRLKLSEYRGLLPAAPRVSSTLVSEAARYVLQYNENVKSLT